MGGLNFHQGRAWPVVEPIIKRLHNKGYQAYIVGGAVRDMLLGLDPSDVDILTNALPRTVQDFFEGQKTKQVGKTFSITLVNGVEVASCRSSETGLSFPESDLAMRDFTMNSMAWDSGTGSLVDPFMGKQDLDKKIIRFTGKPDDRITEDPLRMVRACRFAARYNSRIEPDSLKAIQILKDKIRDQTAGERIHIELVKAMAMEKPSLFFIWLRKTGLLKMILPSLDRCHDLDGGPHHGETVFDHCLLVGDALPASRPMLRLAGFLHDVGKFDAAVLKDGKLSFVGHEIHGDALKSDLEKLRFSNRDMTYILSLFRAHMRPLKGDSSPRAVRRMLAMLDDLGLTFRDFMRLRIADKKGNLAKSPYTLAQIRVRLGKIKDEMNQQTAFNINDLDISGQDIKRVLEIPSGPRIGEIKKYLFEKVLEDPGLNTQACLEYLIKELK